MTDITEITEIVKIADKRIDDLGKMIGSIKEKIEKENDARKRKKFNKALSKAKKAQKDLAKFRRILTSAE